MRTYTLVGFSAALIMLVSKYGFMDVLVNNRIVLDPSRIAAQIVTGIGFIGGGAILKDGVTVRGSATAASIWNAGVIGASVAMERYEIAIILAALNLFTLRALLPLKNWIDRRNPQSEQPK